MKHRRENNDMFMRELTVFVNKLVFTKQSHALLSYLGKSCISACLKTFLWLLVKSYDSSRQCSGRNCRCPN